ncbi:MAG: hypothetical protein AAF957_22275 [Planctomycetota bacterium]
MHYLVPLALSALSSSFALVQQTSDPTDVLDELLAVMPESVPNSFVTTDDGSWLFLGEGATLTFIDFRGRTPSTPDVPGTLEQPMPAPTKRVQIGSLGVLPSEMVLDPEADLTDDGDTTSVLDDADDKDIIYIAGGHFGLWAIEAYPNDGHDNVAVRLDDSGNLDPATQNSGRFCTSVDVATIGTGQYLIALFAKAEKNWLRAYPLQDARDALEAARTSTNDPPNFSHEIGAMRAIKIGRNPDEPALSPAGDVRLGRSYAIGFDVDPSPVDDQLPGAPPIENAVDVYVATMTSGLMRVRLTEVLDTGGDATLAVQGDWGPVFGVGRPTPPTLAGVSTSPDCPRSGTGACSTRSSCGARASSR